MRLVNIDDVNDLFGISDRDIYAKETIEDAICSGQLEVVDALPVVHGHWKEDPSGYGFWICSACGFVSEASAADMLYKFCPVCGAKMDGKDGEGCE